LKFDLRFIGMFIGIWENSFEIQKLTLHYITLHYIITTSKKSWNSCKINLVLNLGIFFYSKYLWKSLQTSLSFHVFDRNRCLGNETLWLSLMSGECECMVRIGVELKRFLSWGVISRRFLWDLSVMFVVRRLKNGSFCCKNKIKTWGNFSLAISGSNSFNNESMTTTCFAKLIIVFWEKTFFH